jgi:hypothetical protein
MQLSYGQVSSAPNIFSVYRYSQTHSCDMNI